jgi:hypothetical protein
MMKEVVGNEAFARVQEHLKGLFVTFSIRVHSQPSMAWQRAWRHALTLTFDSDGSPNFIRDPWLTDMTLTQTTFVAIAGHWQSEATAGPRTAPMGELPLPQETK